ncbi:uncharacterized protein BJ171DRAFT_268953 [Polychytrium aggregatum]|uniref:uncharacterized protein n=1 Tax=Polychytrium aggregatum TaxID=110093 RepID=UPI0022FE6DC5|nr:uncharacterized protein BJ171DRAFT_268953 [Polychytrium aggregatum]KAI9193379.1 hypothetical protein BJ171DRAFT_268953 [Polychytrium aggregatum]
MKSSWLLSLASSSIVLALKVLAKEPTASSTAHVLDDQGLTYCTPQGIIGDVATCDFKSVENVNRELAPLISRLVSTTYFRYYKVNLERQCPFWDDELKCTQPDCAVEEADEEELPDEWKTSSLSGVDFTIGGAGFSSFSKCTFGEDDFCLVEDELSPDGTYVDLRKNPERFTGYSGDSATRIWRSIYSENCFHTEAHGLDNQCLEKRVFHRLVSGLHASISTHICIEHLDRKTGEWGPNLKCFMYRVGDFPERLKNMYYTYAVVLRAIAKLSPHLGDYNFCAGGDKNSGKLTEGILTDIVKITARDPSTFDETQLFVDSQEYLKLEFKQKFRNITQIMDCVSCQKCRLWGKLQTSGLAAALKILFSVQDISGYTLRRSELVALFNAFHRLSESLEAVESFRKLYHESFPTERVTASASRSVEAVPSETPIHEPVALDRDDNGSAAAESSAPSLFSFESIMDSQSPWGLFIGAVIFIFGLARILLQTLKKEIQTDVSKKSQKKHQAKSKRKIRHA